MYKAKQTLGTMLVAMAMSVQAQTPAAELVKNNPITQLLRGQSIDVYADYSIVGAPGGVGVGSNGGALLFNQNQYVRTYKVSTGYDGVGNFRTVAIDQHALVLAAPGFIGTAGTVGKIAIYKKTWDGTHYSPTVSQSFTETVSGTGFGAAVSISDNWIVVGAPTRNIEGGVKLYFRNPSNGVWEDKGWLPLPNFANAPYRFRNIGGPTPVKWDAGFGRSLHVHHNNLIVGAPGIGSFYIYEFNGTNWVYVSENKGTNDLGQEVAISDEYAIATNANLGADVLKKTWGVSNPWPRLQVLSSDVPFSSVATEGSKLVVGRLAANAGLGQVDYYEIKSHPIPNTNTWVNDFVRIGKMHVSIPASPNGLFKVALLGTSVAIYQNTVVAGAPNAQYSPTGYADGAGFRGNFYQFAPAREDGEEETVATSSAYLFPNPATDVVNVSSANEILSASVVNTLGQRTSLPVVGNQVITSDLTAGVYTMTVTTTQGNITQHVVIK